jgi:hypothetical protein
MVNLTTADSVGRACQKAVGFIRHGVDDFRLSSRLR